MKEDIHDRVQRLAVYMIETRGTVRSVAAEFGISKSTVHKDLTQRLPRFHPGLFAQVKELMDTNKAQRHIRGGLATREKYRTGQHV